MSDSLGRRSRTMPQSTGKRIQLQPADLTWLQKLAEHGPLPSSFLLQYTSNTRQSDKRSLERLTDLFNEDNTAHGGCYLTRPPQQFKTLDSRYNQLVYDLAPAGKQAVQELGETKETAAKSGPWLHQCLVACVTASIELATLQTDAVSYISQEQILARAKTTLRYPVTIDGVTKDLIPDTVFGLSYQHPDGPRYRFFVVEADRSTEPVNTTNVNRKSIARSLAQYRTYVSGGLYKEHLKLTAPLLVLNVSTSPERLANMVHLAEQAAYPGGNTYQLFTCWPAFGAIFKPPVPKLELLTGTWQRAGCGEFCIGVP